MASSTNPVLRLLRWGAILAILAGAVVMARPELLQYVAGRGESVDPCRSPLAWHLGSVDPRFGFNIDDVRAAVFHGTRVWEEAAGRQLFRRDTAASMAINLVYDHRQEENERRLAGEARLDTLEREVKALEARLERLEARAERDRAAVESQNTQTAADRYNLTVDRYNRTVEAYNDAVSRYNAVLEGMPGATEVQAGDLRAHTRSLNGRVVAVDRTLTVAVAGGYEELVVVLAHELGHALGLGHVDTEGALMAERYRDDELALPVQLHPADRRALAERCGAP